MNDVFLDFRVWSVMINQAETALAKYFLFCFFGHLNLKCWWRRLCCWILNFCLVFLSTLTTTTTENISSWIFSWSKNVIMVIITLILNPPPPLEYDLPPMVNKKMKWKISVTVVILKQKNFKQNGFHDELTSSSLNTPHRR